MRQLSLFSMICHLPNNPLNIHAKHVLALSPTSAQSWFLQVRDICMEYSLPHPLELLENPPKRNQFKKTARLKVTEFWHQKYTAECLSPRLTSVKYLDPAKCSLVSPHPIWLCAGGSSYESNKSLVVAKMLSGRYRTEMLCRFWSSNTNGYCEAVTCVQVQGDLEHLLVKCPALNQDRMRLFNLWLSKTAYLPQLQDLMCRMISAFPEEKVKFILNPSTHPEMIVLVQLYGEPLLRHVMYLTRTFAFSLHRRKQILTGRWPYPVKKQKQRDNTNLKPLTKTSYFAGSVTLAPQSPAMTRQEAHTSASPTDQYHACTLTTDQSSNTVQQAATSAFLMARPLMTSQATIPCTVSSHGPSRVCGGTSEAIVSTSTSDLSLCQCVVPMISGEVGNTSVGTGDREPVTQPLSQSHNFHHHKALYSLCN